MPYLTLCMENPVLGGLTAEDIQAYHLVHMTADRETDICCWCLFLQKFHKIPVGVIPVGNTNTFSRLFYGVDKDPVRYMLCCFEMTVPTEMPAN